MEIIIKQERRVKTEIFVFGSNEKIFKLDFLY